MYKVKVKKIISKTYKCKGHFFISEKESGITPTICLILENESRVMIPTNKYILEFDDGWFRQEKEKLMEKTNNQVQINDGLK